MRLPISVSCIKLANFDNTQLKFFAKVRFLGFSWAYFKDKFP